MHQNPFFTYHENSARAVHVHYVLVGSVLKRVAKK